MRMEMTCPNCGACPEDDVPDTERQKEVLEYVREFQKQRGHRPSYGQMALHFRVSSRATMAKHVRALERQGFLNRA